ncbi:MAG: SpoIIE family protein phosphatase [Phycisphaerae bacterium]|nr:SpoIIE family protein phosphatase [Phycisphaerae bacterium]
MSTNANQDRQQRPFHHRVRVLLVDDQAMIGEAVRRMLLSQEDIEFHYCQDPKEALSAAASIGPAVILQDLIMPDVDGLDLVLEYRKQETTRLAPLIVLSTKEEADTKAEAFARGANDHLVKLPDPVELIARVRYHSRGCIALLERNEAFDALAMSERALQDELARAADYVRSLLPKPMLEPVRTDWRFIPSISLGGDAFDYHQIDENHLAVYLLDVCGHGVGSALLSVSAMNVVRSQTLPEADFRKLTEVLSGLNRAFPMHQQNNMFFTMWYGVYELSSRKLEYAGAGHPPALIVRRGDVARAVEQLESQAPIIGAFPSQEFPSNVWTINPEDRMFVYSDGVYEIHKSEGGMWGFDDFVEFMTQPAPQDQSKINHLLAHVRQLQGGEALQDDFSMIELDF